MMVPMPDLSPKTNTPNQQLRESQQAQMSTRRSEPIYLNVYDFWPCFNACCSCCGIGVYHTGIEFYKNEYIYFGYNGDECTVGYLQPKSAAYQFKEQILLGFTELTEQQMEEQVMEPLYHDFIGSRYDLLQFNCNHFSRRLAEMLQTDANFPPQVFSVTDCANKLRCCLPDCILSGRLDWFTSSEEDEQYEQLQESVVHPQQQQHHQRLSQNR